MIATQIIKVDLNKRFSETPTVEAIQSDTVRAVAFQLFQGGSEWFVPETATATIRHRIQHEGIVYGSAYDTLPDGNAAYQIDGNTLTVYLTPEVLSIWGVGELQIGLMDDNSVIATFLVLLRVQRNLAFDGITPDVRHDLGLQIRSAVSDWGDKHGCSGSTNTTSIPDYVQTEAQRVAENMLSVRTGQSFSFAAFSDAHMAHNEESQTSAIHAGAGLKAIRSLASLDMAAHLGDYINGGSGDTKASSKEEYKAYHAAMSDGCMGIPTVWLKGNHDANVQGGDEFSDDEAFAFIGSNNQGNHVIDYGNENKLYGYIDFPAKRLRVVYLNTSDGWKTGVSDQQAAWLAATAFDFSDKADAENWGMIILTHIPLTFGDNVKLLAAVNAYTAAPSAELIAIFHGHCHNFRTEQIGNADVWQIGIPELCVGRNNEYGAAGPDDAYGAMFGEFDSEGNAVFYPKTADTAEDTSFNIITIDRGSKTIYCHVFGAGYDRVLSYSGEESAAVYTITNKLTNVTSSNSAATSEENSSYTATLTALQGYVLDGVTVTMGGTDITASVYADGIVTISAVTGNVVITAAAAEVSKYTNLFSADDADFQDAVRFSSSGGASSGSAFISGYIPAVSGDVIRVRCPNGTYADDTNGGNYRCICTYDTNKSNIACYYPGDVSRDADNLGFSYTISNGSVAYIRVSGNPNGKWDGFIVTKNEAIL